MRKNKRGDDSYEKENDSNSNNKYNNDNWHNFSYLC